MVPESRWEGRGAAARPAWRETQCPRTRRWAVPRGSTDSLALSFTAATGEPWRLVLNSCTKHIHVHYSTPSSPPSSKKTNIISPIFKPKKLKAQQIQWFAGSQTSSLNCVRIGHPLCYTSVFFTPLIAKEKTFPFNLSTITAVPPEMLPSETDKAQVTTSHGKISQCLLELWQRWQPSAGPSIFVIRTLQPGTSLLLSWSLPGKCAHSVHIRLYSEHRGWNNSAPCPFLCC